MPISGGCRSITSAPEQTPSNVLSPYGQSRGNMTMHTIEMTLLLAEVIDPERLVAEIAPIVPGSLTFQNGHQGPHAWAAWMRITIADDTTFASFDELKVGHAIQRLLPGTWIDFSCAEWRAGTHINKDGEPSLVDRAEIRDCSSERLLSCEITARDHVWDELVAIARIAMEFGDHSLRDVLTSVWDRLDTRQRQLIHQIIGEADSYPIYLEWMEELRRQCVLRDQALAVGLNDLVQQAYENASFTEEAIRAIESATSQSRDLTSL